MWCGGVSPRIHNLELDRDDWPVSRAGRCVSWETAAATEWRAGWVGPNVGLGV
jgi:hypothetical protein